MRLNVVAICILYWNISTRSDNISESNSTQFGFDDDVWFSETICFTLTLSILKNTTFRKPAVPLSSNKHSPNLVATLDRARVAASLFQDESRDGFLNVAFFKKKIDDGQSPDKGYCVSMTSVFRSDDHIQLQAQGRPRKLKLSLFVCYLTTAVRSMINLSYFVLFWQTFRRISTLVLGLLN
jgi:hypothetical protein